MSRHVIETTMSKARVATMTHFRTFDTVTPVLVNFG